jgi:hypothetical protein
MLCTQTNRKKQKERKVFIVELEKMMKENFCHLDERIEESGKSL